MKHVAERAGVAVASVSRVLSGYPDVSDVMRNRVMDAVAALGYEPDELAQSLRRGSTMTVGFIGGDVFNPLLSEVALGAELTLREAGYAMLVTNSINDASLDAAHIRLLRRRRVDGLLLSLVDESGTEALEELDRSQVPFVLVDRGRFGLSNAGAALSDHASGIARAAQHLITLGHRRIALVNGNPKVRPAKERAKALRRVARSARGVAVTVVPGSFAAIHGETATTALLRESPPPTAIIAGGSQILIGVLKTIRRMRLRIPSDISLVMCDDTPLVELLEPPLGTIGRDPEALGRGAAELLLEQLSGAPPREVILPTVFSPGESCASPGSD
jgi:LacI family transcriptional regulator